MSKYALLIRHRTKPDARDEVKRVWQKHMQPEIAQNPAHELYVYAFGRDPDLIFALQIYSSAEDARAFLDRPAYKAYETEVAPLLAGPPDVTLLHPQWIKGAHAAD